jgi:hypothetical protein
MQVITISYKNSTQKLQLLTYRLAQSIHPIHRVTEQMHRQARLDFEQPAKGWLIADELDIVPNVFDAMAVNLEADPGVCRMKAIKGEELFKLGLFTQAVIQKVFGSVGCQLFKIRDPKSPRERAEPSDLVERFRHLSFAFAWEGEAVDVAERGNQHLFVLFVDLEFCMSRTLGSGQQAQKKKSPLVMASYSYVDSLFVELDIEIVRSAGENAPVCVDRTFAVRVVWELECHIRALFGVVEPADIAVSVEVTPRAIGAMDSLFSHLWNPVLLTR